MKTIAILRFWYEGNSFSPIDAGLDHFMKREWLRGDAAKQFYKGKGVETGAVVDFLSGHRDLEAHFLRCAAAYPAGPLEEGFFPSFIEEIVEGLNAKTWDGIYASLHGSTVARDVSVCETALLERIRAAAPEAIIAASFDLHANLDPRIAELVDIIVGYKTYPHIDMYETGQKAMALLHRALQGEIHPRSTILPAEFVPTSFNMRTSCGPMAEVLREAGEAEKRFGLYDVNAFGGFPYADGPHTGASVTICHEAEQMDIHPIAVRLTEDFRARAALFETHLPLPGEAIGAFLERGRGLHTAILEPSDNSFSGGAGDTPGLLRAALDVARDVPSVFAYFWDPDLVARAFEAGTGAMIDCAFGGRLSPDFGVPVEARGCVETLTEGRFKNEGPMEKGLMVELGPSAVIRVGEIRIIVTSLNVPVNDPAYFKLHSIDIDSFPLLYAKAKNHFRAAFAGHFQVIAETSTPGPAPSDLSGLPYCYTPLERLAFARDRRKFELGRKE